MTEAEFVAGSALGEYTTILRCGAGAYGQVYLARDGQGRRCAVKVLSPDRRGERELNGLLRFQRVSHPNLLRIHRIGVLPDGRVYYSMDAADNAGSGEETYEPDTLARRLSVHGTLPPGELKRIMLELVSGLTELHRAHLIHRDIKPENILFVGGRAVLADAGTVDDAEGASLVGTPEYLPPEVRMGRRDLTAADDCHALGKVLYSALTGESPRKFPSTPHTLESPEQIALFRVAERACTPPGVSVYEFRRLLEHPELLRPRHRAGRLLLAGAALGLIAAAVIAAVGVMRSTSVAPYRHRSPATPAAPHAAESSVVSRREEMPPPTGDVVIRKIRPTRLSSAEFVAKMKADEDRMRAEIKRMQSPVVLPVGEERRDQEAGVKRGLQQEERKLNSSIRIRLEGVKMDLQTAERTRRTFLAKGLDIPTQQKQVDELRAERDRLEAMLELPLEEKRRAFAEYEKQKRPSR